MKRQVDILESMRGEQAEATEIARVAFPNANEKELYGHALLLRQDRYQRGRYLTADEYARYLTNINYLYRVGGGPGAYDTHIPDAPHTSAE